MFPEGRRLDEATFYEACSLLASGRVEEARTAAEALLSREFPKPDGSTGPSRFAHNAEHLLGQVLEVRGDLEGALEAYGRAADFIEDARRALERILETRLEVEGIVALRPGQAGGVPVSYRNAPSVAVRIYPVDLELYFALRKGLGRADRMALAGVTPSVRFEWTPEGGADRGLHRADLPLPRMAIGAYFVILNTGAQEASALVIVSDLGLFLSRTGGSARVEVRGGDGKPVWGARVLLGDGDHLVSSGYTDPRGFFEGDGSDGCWVLASEGGRYALGRLK
jgi:tetratricopeptide (TPR) repeat protein